MVTLSGARPGGWLSEPFVQRLRLGLFACLIVLCFITGGGARDDIASLIHLRSGAIVLATLMLVLPAPVDWKPVRVPLLLCLLFCALMAAQLIPLPPGTWQALPGRALFAEAVALTGEPQPWRPLSVSPDLTLNALAAMVVPLAGLLGFAALDGENRGRILPLLAGAAIVSALLGFLQLASGPDSPLYFYRITNDDSAVGLFSNRNHNAAMLALGFPLLALWAVSGPQRVRLKGTRTIIAAVGTALLVSAVVATRSRAGLAFGAAGAAIAWIIFAQQARRAGEIRAGVWKATLFGLVAIGVLLAALTLLQNASSLDRLLGNEAGSDLRARSLSPLLALTRESLPWGTGFGTFDPVWRIHESHELLDPQYLNHAHNDLLELAITGGMPALVLLAAGLLWLGFAAWRALRPWSTGDQRLLFGRLGLTLLGILLLWSLVDYPLRTPSIALVAAIAAGWLGAAAHRRSRPKAQPAEAE